MKAFSVGIILKQEFLFFDLLRTKLSEYFLIKSAGNVI
ncbi:hypothetical protein FHS59_003179 [Algoriphagus iocasae]|uniref:Uncharacterized protein n=1 Tax=Algoriphagus iocasae TaxID=1836499 RepID=A0A841MTU8_9BACT|nr:hypothetical protein [Algoriphagus iocasae]